MGCPRCALAHRPRAQSRHDLPILTVFYSPRATHIVLLSPFTPSSFSPPTQMLLDWNLLWHALSNALSNAYKYGDKRYASRHYY